MAEATFSSVWQKIGGRKLIAFVLALVALCLLAVFGYLSDTAMWGILGLSATFSGGNAVSHIATAIGSRKGTKAEGD